MTRYNLFHGKFMREKFAVIFHIAVVTSHMIGLGSITCMGTTVGATNYYTSCHYQKEDFVLARGPILAPSIAEIAIAVDSARLHRNAA